MTNKRVNFEIKDLKGFGNCDACNHRPDGPTVTVRSGGYHRLALCPDCIKAMNEAVVKHEEEQLPKE